MRIVKYRYIAYTQSQYVCTIYISLEFRRCLAKDIDARFIYIAYCLYSSLIVGFVRRNCLLQYAGFLSRENNPLEGIILSNGSVLSALILKQLHFPFCIEHCVLYRW